MTKERIELIYQIQTGFQGSLRDVDFNPSNLFDKSFIAVCSQDKKLFIIELGKDDHKNLCHSFLMDKTMESEVWRVKWNKTGSMLAASYIEGSNVNKVAIFRTLDGEKWENCQELFIPDS